MIGSAFLSLLASILIGTSGGWTGSDVPPAFGNEAAHSGDATPDVPNPGDVVDRRRRAYNGSALRN